MNDTTAAAQIALEQRAVEELYRCLDHELSDAHQARQKALSAPVDDPQDLHARDIRVAGLTRTIGERQAAEHGLCFGRLDTKAGETVRVGRIGMRGDDGELVLIDWRAEAARPFYTATPGAPQGVRRRRHLRLAGRSVSGISDELLDGTLPAGEDVVGDGPLIEALGRARTGRMGEAAATLQSEQDAIVRSEHTGVTVVQGGPGTGKTVVALHRAAYILYAFPRIARSGVLVYGPNSRFLDYISEVLPSLGENDVELATAEDLLGPGFQQAEGSARSTRPAGAPSAREAVDRVKGRAEMATGLAGWVRRHQPDGDPLTVTVGQEPLTLDAARVDRARHAARSRAEGHNPAREGFKECIVDDLVDLLEQRAAEALDAIDADVAAMLGSDLDEAAAADLRALGLDEAAAPEGMPGFDEEQARAALADDPGLDAAVERIWPRLDPDTCLREVLRDPVALMELVPSLTAEQAALLVDERGLGRADMALLDEMRVLVDGPPERLFGHIVVDEAQELTEMDWRMLMRRCPARSMTVVGDLAQIGSSTTVRSWAGALGPFVGERFELHTLTVNYRTTAEILRESAPLLSEVAPDQELSHSLRHGEDPRVVTADDVCGAVGEAADADHAGHSAELIGIIACTAQAAALHEFMEEKDAVVVPARQVRGMEFDAVIVVDPAAIRAERPTGAHDLYVAMTRATKRLLTVEP